MSDETLSALIFFGMVLAPFAGGGAYTLYGKFRARCAPAEPESVPERLLFDWEVRAIERECGIGLTEPGYQPSAAVIEAMNDGAEYVGERRLRDPWPLPIDRVWWTDDNKETE